MKQLYYCIITCLLIVAGLDARGPVPSKIVSVTNNSDSPVIFSLVGAPTRKNPMKKIEIVQPDTQSKLTNLVVPQANTTDRGIWIATRQGLFKIYDVNGEIEMMPYSVQNPVVGMTMKLGKTGKIFNVTIGDKGVVTVE